MKRTLTFVLALLTLWTAGARAASFSIEVNGRDFYGETFTDNNETFVALDVIGPLLVGPSFHLDDFEVTLRRSTVTYVPAGASAPEHAEVFPCVKRGAAVYAPLKPLMQALGGSYAVAGDMIEVAYPPAALATAPAPRPTPLAPTVPVALPSPTTRPIAPTPSPTPTSTITPAATPTSAVRPAPTPTSAIMPAPSPAATPTKTSPSPEPPAATPSEAPLTPQVAMAEVQNVNQNALHGNASILKLEVYHPVSPDPSDVIPRTDVAGLKIYLSRLDAADQVDVAMWAGRDVNGKPAFSRVMSHFHPGELEEKAVFVRLPLHVEAGWHTVRVRVNERDTVVYRFVTY